MSDAAIRSPNLSREIRQWWKQRVASEGLFRTTCLFASALWDFARDSTPSRKRQRFGDVDYDWDFRVDTTSANVGWRDRFLGALHSPYQPTDPALFHEMLSNLDINFRDFTFIDLGSGKGRTLLMASDYHFHRIIGVELLPALHSIAQQNIVSYKSEAQRCLQLQSLCCDARDFVFPPEPTVLYLFNPLPASGLSQVLDNVEQSMRNFPRPFCVLYHNPQYEHLIAKHSFFRKMGGTHQYSKYVALQTEVYNKK